MKRYLELPSLVGKVRALVVVELKSYIAILGPPKHKNKHDSGAIAIFFFSFIATVHIYLWMCMVAES